MRFDLLIDVGRFQAGPYEVSDEILNRLWEHNQARFSSKHAFIKAYVDYTVGAVLKDRLRAVAGVSSLDFQDFEVLDQYGNEVEDWIQ
jgi:hypothetical protein